MKAVAIGAVVLGSIASTQASHAATVDARLAVSATILKHASLSVLSQPQSVTVTSADIARGYVDASGPSVVAVKSNSQAGYMLVFERRGDFLTDARVRGLGDEIQLGASGVVPRTNHRGGVENTTHRLMYRFMLSATAQHGTHAWPMLVSIVPM